MTQGYNWNARTQRVPVVQPVLQQLQMHHSDNFGWALACCAWQRDSAEDVLQEAYLRVVDGRARFAGKSTSRTWFFAVIKRVAAEVQRTQKRHGLLNLRVLESGAAEYAPQQINLSDDMSDAAASEESSHQLRACLLQLSTRQREVLHLVFYAELTLQEAAQTLQISLGSARTHYHRGKERMAELLDMEQRASSAEGGL